MNKQNLHQKITTVRGAASLYVVIFTTLLLSVITMSFIRIMLSEATQSTNTDLSQSAYDSALAGVEDAKIALLRYHECINQGYTASGTDAVGSCGRIIYEMQSGVASNSCDVVSAVLGRSREAQQEVVVQETQTSNDAGNSSSMEQAYTCVKISEDLPDYRSTLTAEDRTRIVPLRTTDYAGVKAIRFDWYSSGDPNTAVMGRNNFNTSATNFIPPVTVDIYQTDQNYTLGQLAVNNDAGNGTDHSELTLSPNSRNSGTTKISAGEVLAASSKSAAADLGSFAVNCGNSADFKCQSIIALPETFNRGSRDNSTFFLRVTLPYGQPSSDFGVTMCRDVDCNNVARFVGAQAQIDSTGRANDLYRRVEARVELVDVYYPYPEFAVQLNGNGSALTKNFWVTKNCWTADNGSANGCANNGS